MTEEKLVGKEGTTSSYEGGGVIAADDDACLSLCIGGSREPGEGGSRRYQVLIFTSCLSLFPIR